MSHLILRVLGGVLTLAIGAGVALWIYKKQTYKALSYNVVSISPLMPLQARGFADLRLLKGDKPIEQPFLITIRIANTGDLNISPTDFSVPLTIRPIGIGLIGGKIDDDKLGKMGFSILHIPYKTVTNPFPPQVLDARVASTNPPKIPVEVVTSRPQLEIRPLLLNGGDEFTVEMLINGDVQAIEVTGRIAGISKISEEVEQARKWWPAWAEVAALFGSLLAGVLSAYTFRRR